MRSLLASKLPPSFRPAPINGAGTSPLIPHLTVRRLAAAAMLATLTAVVFGARHSLGETAARLHDLELLPVAFAAGSLLVTLAASAGAWRCALRAVGAELRFREAWGCYGIGSLANAVLPARLGDAVRVGLFAGRLDGRDRRWLSGGACLAVAGARSAVYACTCTGAALAGLLPGWTLAGPAAAAGITILGIAGGRRRTSGRLARLGLAGSLRPTAGGALLGWVTIAAAARLAGAVSLLHALGVANAVGAALVGLAAMAVVGTIPLAPGSAGVAGVGMALALERSGVTPAKAIAAAVAFHALETLMSVVFGSSGWVAMRTAGRPGRRVASVEDCEDTADASRIPLRRPLARPGADRARLRHDRRRRPVRKLVDGLRDRGDGGRGRAAAREAKSACSSRRTCRTGFASASKWSRRSAPA